MNERLLLFFSFDIVGSTAFKKARNYWMYIFEKYFFKFTFDKINLYIENNEEMLIYINKLLGDEIIIKVDIEKKNINEIKKIINDMYSIMLDIDYELYNNSDKSLNVKGASWTIFFEVPFIKTDYLKNPSIDAKNIKNLPTDVPFLIRLPKLPLIIPESHFHNLLKNIDEKEKELIEKYYFRFINSKTLDAYFKFNKYTKKSYISFMNLNEEEIKKYGDRYIYVLDNKNDTLDDKTKGEIINIFDKAGGTINYLSKFEEKNTNILSKTLLIDNTDYIGRRMDEGFRVAKNTTKKVMALSAELAYILQNAKQSENMVIDFMGFKNLKGIWNDNPYPIMWYYDKNKMDKEELEVEQKKLNLLNIGKYYDLDLRKILERNSLLSDDANNIYYHFKNEIN